MSLRIVMACAFFLMMLSIVTAAHADPNMTAVLVLKKGSEVAGTDFDSVLRTDAVIKVKTLFAAFDRKKTKMIAASEISKSWLIELRDDRAFDQLERRIRRAGLPLQLEWNDFKASPQSLSAVTRE
jgi:hypothetical protein